MVIVGSRLNEDATRWPPTFFFLGILFIYAVLSNEHDACIVQVRAEGRPPLLHQVLRERLRQQLRRMWQDHWHRL